MQSGRMTERSKVRERLENRQEHYEGLRVVSKVLCYHSLSEGEQKLYNSMDLESRRDFFLNGVMPRADWLRLPGVVYTSLRFRGEELYFPTTEPQERQQRLDSLYEYRITDMRARQVCTEVQVGSFTEWERNSGIPLSCSDFLKEQIRSGAVLNISEAGMAADGNDVNKVALERLQAKAATVLQELPDDVMHPKAEFSPREAYAMKMVADSAFRLVEGLGKSLVPTFNDAEELAHNLSRSKSLG